MDYTQLTLDDWLSFKESLKKDLNGVQESFVRIGYKLRKIEEERLYEQDGHKSIAEFAAAEYGLSASTVSRFMAINRKYSIGGYSEQLRSEFANLGSSKLSEMLSLPDKDLEMIQPEATRESIRELKQFNKTAPEEGGADDFASLIRIFLQENPDVLKEMKENPYLKVSEIANPSGNRTYRKGKFFLMMYESDLVLKEFGGEMQRISWERFGEVAAAMLEEMELPIEGTENEDAPKENEIVQEESENAQEESENTQEVTEIVTKKEEKEAEQEKVEISGQNLSPIVAVAEPPKADIAPAQKVQKTKETSMFFEGQTSMESEEKTEDIHEEKRDVTDYLMVSYERSKHGAPVLTIVREEGEVVLMTFEGLEAMELYEKITGGL